MSRFHLALAALYDLAEQASHNDFPVEALKLLQPWIDFDGAVLWSGDSVGGTVSNLLAAHIYIHRQYDHDKNQLGGRAHVLAMAHAARALLGEMKSPTLRDCRRHPLQGLESCPQQHEWQHLMLFGESSLPEKPGRWIMLYRNRDVPFTALEAEYLYAAWFHLVHALDINLSRVLDRNDPERLQRASALINEQGFIIAADAHFHRLLHWEWPNYQRARLLQPALSCLLRGGTMYRGQRIVISMMPQSGYTACLAHALQALAGLTPSEYAVGRCFANGLSHKAIARETGRSPNTVRNQIARLYDKLGVNNKAALAQHFAQHLSRGTNIDPEH